MADPGVVNGVHPFYFNLGKIRFIIYIQRTSTHLLKHKEMENLDPIMHSNLDAVLKNLWSATIQRYFECKIQWHIQSVCLQPNTTTESYWKRWSEIKYEDYFYTSGIRVFASFKNRGTRIRKSATNHLLQSTHFDCIRPFGNINTHYWLIN